MHFSRMKMADETNSEILSGPATLKFCGGICGETLRRWQKDPGMNFPKAIKINRRLYFRRSDLEQWLAERQAAE